MRYFFDTEFIEDGKTIDLISIGIVAEDGLGYYAESSNCDLSRASEWVRANVLPKLTRGLSFLPRKRIADEIKRFVSRDDSPEFWAYYADYDWVALCQLYGTMMQLPDGWPKYCLDLKQLVHSIGNPLLQRQEGGDHNALADAQWVRKTWLTLQKKNA